MGELHSVYGDWIVQLIKSSIVSTLVNHISLEESFEEQLKDVKQEMFLESSFYIRVELTLNKKNLRRYSKSLVMIREKSLGFEKYWWCRIKILLHMGILYFCPGFQNEAALTIYDLLKTS